MPTYEYECSACGNAFEAFQSIKDGALRKCPGCGKLRLRRVVSAGAGVIFKGSGFYETDYRKPGPAGKQDGEKPPSAQNKDDGKSKEGGGEKKSAEAAG